MESSSPKWVRIDTLVAQKYPTLSNRHIEEALEHELILDTEGKKLKKGTKVLETTSLNFQKLNAHLESLKKGNPDLKVEVAKDLEDFCIVTKPPGLQSHPISLFDTKTMTNWAYSQFKGIAEEFPETQPTISPHRLDTDTEGLLIVCKTKASFDEWRERFKTKQIKKRYLAWVQGLVNENVLIDLPIAHNPKNKAKMLVVEGEVKYNPPLLSATSEIIPIRKLETKGISLVEVTCLTGVTHQVRVHLAHLGHPLVGDKLYDPDFEKRSVKADHHLLLAFEISFDGQTYSIEKNKFLKLYF